MAEGENKIVGSDESSSSSGELPAGLTAKAGAKRGRPAGSRNRGTPLDTGSREENRSSSGANPDALESAKFLGVGFVALIELGESFVHSSCANRIEKKLPSKLAEFKEMAKALGLQEKDKEVMSSCVEKIAAKYDWMTKHGPEIVLGVMCAQYGLRQVSLLRFVENVTKEKPREETHVQPDVKPAEIKA